LNNNQRNCRVLIGRLGL